MLWGGWMSQHPNRAQTSWSMMQLDFKLAEGQRWHAMHPNWGWARLRLLAFSQCLEMEKKTGFPTFGCAKKIASFLRFYQIKVPRNTANCNNNYNTHRKYQVVWIPVSLSAKMRIFTLTSKSSPPFEHITVRQTFN